MFHIVRPVNDRALPLVRGRALLFANAAFMESEKYAQKEDEFAASVLLIISSRSKMSTHKRHILLETCVFMDMLHNSIPIMAKK